LSTEHSQSGNSGGYERRDANPASLVHFCVGLALTLVVAWAGMWWLLGYFGRVQPLGPPATPFQRPEERQLPPLPRLQVEPVLELNQARNQQRAEIDTYGWVDRGHGIVHIPIDRAMDLILERGGLPARPEAGATGATGTHVPAAPAKAKSRRGRSAP
jgi:hypothetical protein